MTTHNGIPVIAEPGAVGARDCAVHKLWLRSPSTRARYDSGWLEIRSETSTNSEIDLNHEVGLQNFAHHEVYGEIEILSGNNMGFVAPMIYMMPFTDYWNENYGGVSAMFNSTELKIYAPRGTRYGFNTRKFAFFNPFDQSSTTS